MQVWLNGSFTDRDAARVSAFDAGLQHAVGLFETLRASNGRVFRAEAHLARLAESARRLRLTERLHPGPLAEAVQHTVERNGLEAARVRLTITGGDLNLLQSQGRAPTDPTVLIVAQPPTAYPDAFFEEGVMVTIAEGRENPFIPTAGHKTLSYWPRINALQAAAARRGGEALWFSVTNHLVGGSVSNAFVVKDGQLRTPIARGEEAAEALPAGVLPGITRAAVMELARSRDIPVETKLLDIQEVLGADEVFLTNSSWGILPVVAVEAESIGNGAVGALTTTLREALLELIEGETTAPAG